jgi:hypothetical protein
LENCYKSNVSKNKSRKLWKDVVRMVHSRADWRIPQNQIIAGIAGKEVLAWNKDNQYLNSLE